ncbi:MAG TPA: hypothetical protein GXZ90_03265 [Clostridiales bacterium]|nr:hypothetical protein [Clostridiales bacterium]
MNAVLTTHFLIEKRMDSSFILNEIALLAIGMGIGILLNMLMVNNIKRIKKNQLDVDKMIKECVNNVAKLLESKKDINNEDIYIDTIPNENINNCPEFEDLDDFLEDSLEAAYNNAKNTLLSDTKYHISYLDMRKHQVSILKSMVEHINKVPTFIKQAQPLSYFLKKISYNFNEDNTAEELLEEINSLKEIYRKEKLPSTRVEFENRAILFQLLIDIEIFLKTKNDFILEFGSDIE